MMIYDLADSDQRARVSLTDMVWLEPPNGAGHRAAFSLEHAAAVAWAARVGARVHFTGPSGSGKSTLLSYMLCNPRNMARVQMALRRDPVEVRTWTVPLSRFEGAPDLRSRRAIGPDGQTVDEDSLIVAGIKEALELPDSIRAVLWIQEPGRCATQWVQSALVTMMEDRLTLADGRTVSLVGRLGWVFDSNYLVEDKCILANRDDGFFRRMVNITLGYPTAEQEQAIVMQLRPDADPDLVRRLVELGADVRARRGQGALTSVAPPCLNRYLDALSLVAEVGMSPLSAAEHAVLGGANADDQESVTEVLNRAFGLRLSRRQSARRVAL